METSRRLFLGSSLAAAVPLTLDWQTFAQSARPRRGDARVLDHVARELAAVHARVMRTKAGKGEDVRVVAANIRLLVSADASLDAQLAAALDVIRQRGQEAFIADPLPQSAAAALQRELRRYGVGRDLPSFTDLSPELRRKAFTTLSAQGASKVLLAAAAQLDIASAALDNTRDGIARVQLTGSACCDLYWNYWTMYLVAGAISWACPICGIEMGLAAAALQAIYDMNCGRTDPCF